MNTRRLTLLATAAALLGCRAQQQAAVRLDEPDAVVARFAGGEIHRREIADAVTSRVTALPVPSDQGRREAVRTVVERRARIALLYRQAIDAGLDRSEEAKTRIAARQARLLAERWLAGHTASVHAEAGRVEAELQRRAALNDNQQHRSFHHIFLRAASTDGAARTAAEKTMATIRAHLAEGRSFEDLARQYSDSVTARAGGRIDWTASRDLHPAVSKVVFALSPGQLSEVVKSKDGLHLFRVDEVRGAPQRTAAELRRQVTEELDREAVQAAVTAARDEAFDSSKVVIDAPALARAADHPETDLAHVDGSAIRAGDLALLRRVWPLFAALPPERVLREMVADRVLAARLRADGLLADMQGALAEAARNELVSIRREQLMADIDTKPTEAEVRAFYEHNRDTTIGLRDHFVDVLFFAQTGKDVGSVYAEGERITKALRNGVSFEQVLRDSSVRPGVVAQRNLGGLRLEQVQTESNRIHDALVNLVPGEVSAPLYVSEPRLFLGEKEPVVSGPGVIFVRLARVAPTPFPVVEQEIRETLSKQKERAGIAEIQRQLDQQARVEILAPLG